MSTSSSNIGTQTKHTELVRVFTCGSVDDGKSTLIGRLLLDADHVPVDTLAALKEDSENHGTVNGSIDPALLTDGLSSEREQGITIDVAYRYFTRGSRHFILADAPGHEQYTRNMATAASTASIAVILVDAGKGILEQTKRHSFIASLLGIKHVVIAVNKMDSVDFSEEAFLKIREDFEEFAVRLETVDLHFIPVSALQGDNIVESSNNMPWYSGGTLMHFLDTVHVASDRNLVDFRFPVQYVNRPNDSYRGYAGVVESGAVRPGDSLVVLPHHEKVTVKSIDTFDGSLETAFAPQSVTLTFEEDVDIARGDMIAPQKNIPHIDTSFEAMCIWMDDEPLNVGHEYMLKHTTRMTSARVHDLQYAIDTDTLHRRVAGTLEKNDIGRVTIESHTPLLFDSYDRNHATGSLILIDRMTNRTVGICMILDRKKDLSLEGESEKFPILWFTGNSGAGKSTLAEVAADHINTELSLSHPAARKCIVLDGDEMRATISTEEDLSPDGRRAHNLRVARLAAHLRDQGFLVVVSVIAPFENVREEIAMLCDPQWIYVKKSNLEAEDRPYEEPKNPSLIIDHDTLSKDEAKNLLLERIHELL